MASALGGLPTLPGTFNGQLVNRKLYFFFSLHVWLNAFKSQSSPMFMPNRERKY